MKKISLMILLLMFVLSLILCNSNNTEYFGSYAVDKESIKEKMMENRTTRINTAILDVMLSIFDKIRLEIKKDNTFSMSPGDGTFVSGTVKQIDNNTLELVPDDKNQPSIKAKIDNGKIIMKDPSGSNTELILSKKKE
jgi:hypothetical protein